MICDELRTYRFYFILEGHFLTAVLLFDFKWVLIPVVITD